MEIYAAEAMADVRSGWSKQAARANELETPSPAYDSVLTRSWWEVQQDIINSESFKTHIKYVVIDSIKEVNMHQTVIALNKHGVST